jgi:isopentenyl phosphate kinase
MQPVLIKFGGSVITRPDHDNPFDLHNTQRLASEFAGCRKPCILVHGTGSIGKPAAVRHGYVHDGFIAAQQRLLANRIRHSLRELSRQLVAVLLETGIPAFPVDASLLISEDLSGLRHPGAARELLDLARNGSLPVLHGDHVPCADGRFRVLSSDVIVAALARELNPSHVLFLTDVDGVYADDRERGSIIADLDCETLEQVACGQSDHSDVSGGMRAKLACALEAARHCDTCRIANGRRPGVLADLLAGRQRGTRVRAS